MKKFKLFKTLLVLGVLMTSINTAMADDRGFNDKGGGFVQFYRNNTYNYDCTLNGTGVSDFEMGTITTSLKINYCWAKVWGGTDIFSAIRFEYRLKTKDAGTGPGYTQQGLSWHDNMGGTWNQYWEANPMNTEIDLSGLAPGDYEIEFYFIGDGKDVKQYWLSNNSGNYHANFDIPSKNLTVAGGDSHGNAVSGSQTGIAKGTAYTITATPKVGYRFTGWTATSGSSSITITDASSATTTVTFNDYENDATVTASFERIFAYVEGRFQIYNPARNTRTAVGGRSSWVTNSAAIQMEYDDTNRRFVLHTYSKPSELKADFTDAESGDAGPYFYIKTSTSSIAISTGISDGITEYWATSSDDSKNVLIEAGTKRAVSKTSKSLTFIGNTGDENGYVVLYCDGEYIWYDLEYILEYDGNGNTSGSIPTGRAYYAAGATPATALNSNSLAKDGYNFNGWSTTSGVDQVSTITAGSSLAAMSADVTLYAAWEDDKTIKYTDASNDHKWSTTSNWSKSKLPTKNYDVTLTKPVNVDIDHAQAKSIVIDKYGDNTGRLTVQANRGLEVTGTIRLKNAAGNTVVTEASDIVLESDENGNATLIFDNAVLSTNYNKATVYMYSKGWTDGTQGEGDWNWQMVGVPVSDATRLNDYYGGYMYEWSSGWVDKTDVNATLTPFLGYSVTYPTDEDRLHTYEIDGTLIPTGNMSISIPANTAIQAVANSWTAPIYVKNITFTNSSPANIYIYNTGYAGGGTPATKSAERWAAGTYHAVPVNSSPYTGDSLIAPMQGFYVRNKLGTAGTININYDNVVRPTGSRNINAGQMHAPKRVTEEVADPTVMKIYVSGTENDDRVVLLERSDFSRGFDNGWDGEKFQVNAVTTAPRLFAINETGGKEEISAIPEFEGTVIGFRPGTDDNYKISFEYSGSETLYLKDTKNDVLTLIDNESEYNFTSNGENEDSRFLIYKAPAITTGTDHVGDGNSIHKQMINGQLYIIRDGQIYDMLGKTIK